MTDSQWAAFTLFRTACRQKCSEWNRLAAVLAPLQKEAAAKDTPPYPLETAVVYSRDIDTITKDSTVKLIVIGDNPGKDEQLEKNRRYLVGQSGKIAEGFFRRNPELAVDFRHDVLILNKTPVHTAKTAHLKYLSRNGSSEIQDLILQSQLWMAQETARLHCSLDETELWLVGYAELKEHGIFVPYRDELSAAYGENCAWNKVRVYQHFSMNRFLIDLASFRSENSSMTLSEALCALGTQHRKEIFGR